MSINDSHEGYVICPYERHHQILPSRLQFHLVKCKKVYKGDVKLIECPFNTTHMVPEIEMNCHKQYTCPDRNRLDTFLAAQESEPLFPVKPIELESSEDWDDINCPTYDPMEKCKNTATLLHFQCEPPALRKQCRSEERERLARLAAAGTTSQQLVVSTSSIRLPQTLANTYTERSERPRTIALKHENTNGLPTIFGRGRGRILQ